jgi:hypothetical protein
MHLVLPLVLSLIVLLCVVTLTQCVSRKDCFTSKYFKGCVDSLMLQDELEKIQTWIKQLHGADPGVL